MAAGKKLFHVLMMSHQCNCHELISASNSGAFSGCAWVSFFFCFPPHVAASGDRTAYNASESREGEGLGSREEKFWASWGGSRHGQLWPVPLFPVKTGYPCNCASVPHPSEPAMWLIMPEVVAV